MRREYTVIEQEVLLPGTPEAVFEAYTDPSEHAEFTGSSSSGEAKVGSEFTAWDGYIIGRYTGMVKGKKITHEWKTTEWPDGYPPSTVKIILSAKGGKTLLVMTHTRVPKEQAEEYRRGWTEFYWEPLERYMSKKKTARRKI